MLISNLYANIIAVLGGLFYINGDSVTIAACCTFSPIQLWLIVVLPHIHCGHSLQLTRLRVLFTTIWLFQMGSPLNTITA